MSRDVPFVKIEISVEEQAYQDHTHSKWDCTSRYVHNVTRCRIAASNSCTKEKARSSKDEWWVSHGKTKLVTRWPGHRHNWWRSSSYLFRHKYLIIKYLIIKERRLRWLRHVLWMDDNRLPRQAVHWDISGSRRKPSGPRKNWIDTIQQDLKSINMTWEVAQQLAVDREGWRRRVAQRVSDTGWTKDSAFHQLRFLIFLCK